MRLREYKAVERIVYKQIEGQDLALTMFEPHGESDGPSPVVLYVHGGGWTRGDRFKVLDPAFRGCLDRLLHSGIAVASLDYRLAERGRTNATDSVEDCKDAARFLIARSEQLGIDATRMGVWGASAGGHLALMTALTPHDAFVGVEGLRSYDPRFSCVVAYYPATTFMAPELLRGVRFERLAPLLFGDDDAERDARITSLSPIGHLSAEAAPLLLVHGERDEVLPHEMSSRFVAAAVSAGADAQLLSVRNAGHVFTGVDIAPAQGQIDARVADFIGRYLLKSGRGSSDPSVSP